MASFSLAVRLEITQGSMAEVLQLFNDLLPDLRAEKGCLAFAGHVDAEHPNILWLYESYESSVYHQEVHSSRPEIKRVLEALTSHLASPWEAWSGDVVFAA